MHHPTDRITHTTACVTPVVEHWLETEITQWVHNEGLIRRPIAPRSNALTTELHLSFKTTSLIAIWKLGRHFLSLRFILKMFVSPLGIKVPGTEISFNRVSKTAYH